jgi:hypothetical protein
LAKHIEFWMNIGASDFAVGWSLEVVVEWTVGLPVSGLLADVADLPHARLTPCGAVPKVRRWITERVVSRSSMNCWSDWCPDWNLRVRLRTDFSILNWT